MPVHALSLPGAGPISNRSSSRCTNGLTYLLSNGPCIDVVLRHDVLRTRFRFGDVDEPRQEVLARAEQTATVADWRDLAPDEAERKPKSTAAPTATAISTCPVRPCNCLRCSWRGSRTAPTASSGRSTTCSAMAVLHRAARMVAIYDAAQRGERH